jgi:hypothetical protein
MTGLDLMITHRTPAVVLEILHDISMASEDVKPPAFATTRSVPVRRIAHEYQLMDVLIVGSSYEDCVSLEKQNYAGIDNVQSSYYVWNETSLRAHDGLRTEFWRKSDSADFWLWAKAMERYVKPDGACEQPEMEAYLDPSEIVSNPIDYEEHPKLLGWLKNLGK